MKKTVVSILLLLAMLFSFAACGDSSDIKKVIKSEGSQAHVSLANVYDYIELCDYKNYEFDWESGDAASALASALSNNYTAEEKLITDRPIQSGDTVNIDYVGKKDGVRFEGGTASGYDLTIGSKSFIDGFEEGLIGVSLGETVDLNLKFPEAYHSADLAGAEVVFTVTVNSITEKTYSKEDIAAAKEDCIFDLILVYTAANSEFKSLPQGDYDVYKKQLLEQYDEETADKYAEETTKQLVSIFAIAKNEGVEVSDKEYQEQMKYFVENYGKTAEEIEETYGENYIDLMVLLEKLPEVFK